MADAHSFTRRRARRRRSRQRCCGRVGTASTQVGAVARVAGVRTRSWLRLMALAAVLNLWALIAQRLGEPVLQRAVRSMSSSWHDFLYASLDRGGVMTVDKPPLALWVQALSVRVFGFTR